MKDGLHAGNKMNSLARSNASLYGNKDDLYDRLRRHAYQGKKSGKELLHHQAALSPEIPISTRKIFARLFKLAKNVRVNLRFEKRTAR